MTFSDISYFKIIDTYFTEATIRILCCFAIFGIAYILTKYKKIETNLNLPWSFNYPIKLLCLFIALGYLFACLLFIFLKTVHNYNFTNISFISTDINYVISIINSLFILLIVNYVIRKKFNINLTIIGYQKKTITLDVQLGVLVSIIYFTIIFLIAKGAFILHNEQYLLNIYYHINVLSVVSTVCFAPIAEELFFRGILFKTFNQKLSFSYAAAISSLFFVVYHAHIAKNAILIFALGYFLAYLFFKSKSVIPCMILHGSTNFFILLGDHNNGIVIKLMPWSILLFCSVLIIPLSLVGIKKVYQKMLLTVTETETQTL
jgi:membrane protease YdiL (CAAX protease family)